MQSVHVLPTTATTNNNNTAIILINSSNTPPSPPSLPSPPSPRQSVRSLSSVGTAVLGNFRTVLLVMMSAALLGELSDWGMARWVGCVNTFVGAAAYGLHPKLCDTPVSREMSMTPCAARPPTRLDRWHHVPLRPAPCLLP